MVASVLAPMQWASNRCTKAPSVAESLGGMGPRMTSSIAVSLRTPAYAASSSRRSWDHVMECGVAHYARMPEFLFDARIDAGGEDVYESLMQFAGHFVDLWSRAEAASRSMH